MALIDYVTEENATGKAREYFEDRSEGSSRYAEIRDQKARSLYTGLRLHNPEVTQAQSEFSSSVFEAGLVDEDLYEILMVAVAQENQCDYCAGSHRENLDLLLDMDDETIESMADGDFSDLPDLERAVAEFGRKCIADPHRIDEADLESLYEVGFEDSDVIQLLALVGSCNTANLIVNTLNAHPADLDHEFRY